MSYTYDKKGAYISSDTTGFKSLIPWSVIVGYLKAGKIRGFTIDSKGNIKNDKGITVYSGAR